jgi:hypothetical protein
MLFGIQVKNPVSSFQGNHIMLRDFLTQKCEHKKSVVITLEEKVTDFGYPRACRYSNVDSENIKLKIGFRNSAYQFFSKCDFHFIKCG